MLLCNKCKILKEESSFHISNINKRGFSHYCKDCNKIRRKEHYLKNKDKELKMCKEYQKLNKESIARYSKVHSKEYYLKNKEYILFRTKQYVNAKYKSDINFRLTSILRHRIWMALNENVKSKRTKELIGCDMDFLKAWLNITTLVNGYENFDINNYSGQEYHIDHKVPCAVFKLDCSYHQKLCFNWTNLQILTAEKNMSKNDKFNNED